jgi:hypothetical protein
MPAVDVGGAAENVSLISYVGIWQFLLIVLVIASVSISFVFDFDISAVLAQQSPISLEWRNESSWWLVSEHLQGEAKPKRNLYLRACFHNKTHRRHIPETPPQRKNIFDSKCATLQQQAYIYALPRALDRDYTQIGIQDRVLFACKQGTANLNNIVAAASLLKDAKNCESVYQLNSRSGNFSFVSDFVFFQNDVFIAGAWQRWWPRTIPCMRHASAMMEQLAEYKIANIQWNFKSTRKSCYN